MWIISKCTINVNLESTQMWEISPKSDCGNVLSWFHLLLQMLCLMINSCYKWSQVIIFKYTRFPCGVSFFHSPSYTRLYSSYGLIWYMSHPGKYMLICGNEHYMRQSSFKSICLDIFNPETQFMKSITSTVTENTKKKNLKKTFYRNLPPGVRMWGNIGEVRRQFFPPITWDIESTTNLVSFLNSSV